MLADADPKIRASLYKYGDALGTSFQIADDILDFVGNEEQVGKKVGDDFRERKLTLPIIHAISRANESASLNFGEERLKMVNKIKMLSVRQ